jgi:hypothetical protein
VANPKFIAIVFLFFAGLGSLVPTHSWEGVTYVYTGSGDRRLPAAVGKGVDFSELKGHALFLASQKRVIEEAKMVVGPDAVGVELGHFLIRNVNGEKEFACKKYPRVLLQFIAVGTAESGESPVMEVESDCVVGESISKIEPIWIPTMRLKGERPGSFELKLNEPYKVDFRFDHMGQHWPKAWVLNAVSLFSEKTGESLLIPRQEILESLEQPLEVKF